MSAMYQSMQVDWGKPDGTNKTNETNQTNGTVWQAALIENTENHSR
jgi:hypothetical protein